MLAVGLWSGVLLAFWLELSGQAIGPSASLAAPVWIGLGLGLLAWSVGPRTLASLRALVWIAWVLWAGHLVLDVPLGIDARRALPWWVMLAGWGVWVGPWLCLWMRAAAPLALGAAGGVLLVDQRAWFLPAPQVPLAAEGVLGAAALLLVAGGARLWWRRRTATERDWEAHLNSGAEAELAQPFVAEGSAYGWRLVGLLFLCLATALGLAITAWWIGPAATAGPLPGQTALSLGWLGLAIGLGLARWFTRRLHAPLSLDVALWVTTAVLAVVWLAPWPVELDVTVAAQRWTRLACLALGLGLIASILLNLLAVWIRGLVLLAAGALLSGPALGLGLVEVGLERATLGLLGVALVLVFVGAERVAPDVGRVWSAWGRRTLAATRHSLWLVCAAGLVLVGWRWPDAWGQRLDLGGTLVWSRTVAGHGVVPGLQRMNWSRNRMESWLLGQREPSADERAAFQAAGAQLGSLLGVPAAEVDLALTRLAITRLDQPAEWRARWAARAADSDIWVGVLPLDLTELELDACINAFERGVPWASLWFVHGVAFLVGAANEPPLDLAEGALARRTLEGFVAVLQPAGDWDAAAQARALTLERVKSGSDSVLRRRARNLEAIGARRTEWPMDWQLLVGPTAVPATLERSREVFNLHTAAAWVAYCRAEAPGSLALESWELRLLEARADVLSFIERDPELRAFDAVLKAEDSLQRARLELAEQRPMSALGLLLSARRELGARGDLELPLAAAFALAGDAESAETAWRGLGARGPKLLSGPEAWLLELGYAPPPSEQP